MKSSRHHSWLVTLPLVAIVAAYLWLVVQPGRRAITALKTELADKRAFIAGGQRVRLCMAQVEREFDALRGYCRQWEAESCDSAQLAALYGKIAELLKASGVVTTHFAPGPTLKLDVVRKTSLRIEYTGTFRQLASVMTGLEKLPGRLWIEDLNLELADQISPSEHAQSSKTGQLMRCEVNLAIFAGNSKKFD